MSDKTEQELMELIKREAEALAREIENTPEQDTHALVLALFIYLIISGESVSGLALNISDKAQLSTTLAFLLAMLFKRVMKKSSNHTDKLIELFALLSSNTTTALLEYQERQLAPVADKPLKFTQDQF